MNVTFPLAAVDAALKLACRDTKGLSHYRQEEIPGRLIVYRINQPDPPAGLGPCGGIRVQYLSEQHTKLSIEIEACSEELGARCGLPPENSHMLPFDDLIRVMRENGIRKIESYRQQSLVDLCNRAIFDLTNNQPPRERAYKPPSQWHGGRPPLSQEECALRMALGLLEEHLKRKDQDTKRGEVVLLAVEKLNIPAGIGDVKDGMERLRKARHANDQNLLQSAEELIQSWMPRLAA